MNLADAEHWARHHAPTCPPLATLTAELDRLRAELLWKDTITHSVVHNFGDIDREIGASLDRLTTALQPQETGEQP